MNETPIDAHNLRAEIEMLHGQTRAMRRMIAALILSNADAAKMRTMIALMQGDLEEELRRPTNDADHARKNRLGLIGATAAQRDLHSILETTSR